MVAKVTSALLYVVMLALFDAGVLRVESQTMELLVAAALDIGVGLAVGSWLVVVIGLWPVFVTAAGWNSAHEVSAEFVGLVTGANVAIIASGVALHKLIARVLRRRAPLM